MEKTRVEILCMGHCLTAPHQVYGPVLEQTRWLEKCQQVFFGSEPWTWPLGYGGWYHTLVLAGGAASGGFFSAKKQPYQNIISEYTIIII